MKLERRAQIAELIQKQRTVNNAELMERFGISIETVRRDLDALERQGVLRKVYGGAVVNVICMAVGVVAALMLDKFNQKHAKE